MDVTFFEDGEFEHKNISTEGGLILYLISITIDSRQSHRLCWNAVGSSYYCTLGAGVSRHVDKTITPQDMYYVVYDKKVSTLEALHCEEIYC